MLYVIFILRRTYWFWVADECYTFCRLQIYENSEYLQTKKTKNNRYVVKTPNASEKIDSSPRRLAIAATYPPPAMGAKGGSHFSISTSDNGSYLPFFISRMHVPLSRACTVCHMPIGILTATFSPPGSITNDSVHIPKSS